MNHVARGQLWSLMDSERPRFTFRVKRILGRRVVGELAGGKVRTISLSVLTHGHRGARLVENADGTPVEEIKPIWTPREEDSRKASDYVREVKPRGVVTARANHAEALAMSRAGRPHREIAAKFGIDVKLVAGWLRTARDAEMDERNRKAG